MSEPIEHRYTNTRDTEIHAMGFREGYQLAEKRYVEALRDLYAHGGIIEGPRAFEITQRVEALIGWTSAGPTESAEPDE